MGALFAFDLLLEPEIFRALPPAWVPQLEAAVRAVVTELLAEGVADTAVAAVRQVASWGYPP